ncbi:hypothetical protein SLA2020_000570 [Shorea laevis]
MGPQRGSRDPLATHFYVAHSRSGPYYSAPHPSSALLGRFGCLLQPKFPHSLLHRLKFTLAHVARSTHRVVYRASVFSFARMREWEFVYGAKINAVSDGCAASLWLFGCGSVQSVALDNTWHHRIHGRGMGSSASKSTFLPPMLACCFSPQWKYSPVLIYSRKNYLYSFTCEILLLLFASSFF